MTTYLVEVRTYYHVTAESDGEAIERVKIMLHEDISEHGASIFTIEPINELDISEFK